jgi:hypothetical protein
MERVSRRMFIGIEAWLQGPGRVGRGKKSDSVETSRIAAPKSQQTT